MTANKSAHTAAVSTATRRSAAPGWQPFAHKVLQRLREAAGEAPPDPDLGPTPPSTLPPRMLLMALRLAASFGDQRAITAALRPCVLTVLRGIPASDLPLLRRVLPALLPGAWRIGELRSDDSVPTKHPGASTLHLLTVTASERSSDQQRQLSAGLESLAPLLIIVTEGVDLPEARLARHAALHAFAPIDADITWALLEALGRVTDPTADRAALRQAFDGERHLDSTDLLLALRAPTLVEVAQRLAPDIATPGDASAPPTLDSIPGDSPALQAARHMVEDLQLWRAGRAGWAEIPRTVLFHGPPGTGKTWLARAMAGSAGVSSVTGSFGEWQAAGHLGDMLKAMRRSFAEARARAPALLILDELDAVGSRNDGTVQNQNYRVQVINAFLALMDEIARDPGVVVVATCNHPELIDPAVLRPGRFDLRVAVGLPDAATLAGVLRRHLVLPDPEIADLARHCIGLSLAACDAELRAARSEARRAGVQVDAARLIARLSSGRDPVIEHRIAVHECGHAMVTHALGRGIVQRIALEGNGGATRIQRHPQPGLITDYTDLLAEFLAGRAAERLILADISAGAGGPADSDLALATRVALDIETRYGLGTEGPLWRDADPTALWREPDLRSRCRHRIETAEARAAAILTPHLGLLAEMAEALQTQRELSGGDLTPWLQRLDLAVAAQAMMDTEHLAVPPD